MFWSLSNFSGAHAPESARRARPSLEILDGRDVPSVSVTPLTDSNGAAELRIVTNGANDTVSVTDDSTAGTTTVVADGKTTTFNHQFARFDLELLSKKDTVAFALNGAFNGRHADVLVNLGTGENHFTFNPGLTALTNHSDLNLNIRGHNGNDFLNLSFGDILESRLDLSATNLGGSKSPLSPTAPARDTITFGTQRAGGRNAAIDVNVGFGQGNNSLLFNYGIDLGHIANPTGVDTPANFGPGTFNVNITDSARRQDSDNVTVFANGEINTGSTLNFNTQLGGGKDSFTSVFDANLFQVDDDGGVFSPGPTPGTFSPHSGGAVHFNVLAGTGPDTIDFHSINQAHTIELSGLFDINILGGSGKDNINVNFGGPGGFTDDDPFELAATNRAFRLRIDGGSGNDTIGVNLSNAQTATFAYDVAINGGSGKNNIIFVGVNPGGHPSFGPAGSVLIDPGPGDDNQVQVFGNFPTEVL